jgi:hypothetical protein
MMKEKKLIPPKGNVLLIDWSFVYIHFTLLLCLKLMLIIDIYFSRQVISLKGT